MSDQSSIENKTYSRPPIIEAAVEFRLDVELADKKINRIGEKFLKEYGSSKNEVELKLELKLDSNKATKKETFVGKLISNEEQSRIILIRKNSIVFIEKPPYAGWEALRSRITRELKVVTDEIGRPLVERIGVRYINRIDIPANLGEQINAEDYLNLVPKIPYLGEGPVQNYLLRIEKKETRNDLTYIISSGKIDAPIPEHDSLLLDIDVISYGNFSIGGRAMLSKMDVLRESKNKVFENCITEQTRKLIS